MASRQALVAVDPIYFLQLVDRQVRESEGAAVVIAIVGADSHARTFWSSYEWERQHSEHNGSYVYHKRRLSHGKPVKPVLLAFDDEGRLREHDGCHRALAARDLGIHELPARIRYQRKGIQ